jgi:hypothetical protein
LTAFPPKAANTCPAMESTRNIDQPAASIATGRNSPAVCMSEINKKALTDRDICTKFITPALDSARWI